MCAIDISSKINENAYYFYCGFNLWQQYIRYIRVSVEANGMAIPIPFLQMLSICSFQHSLSSITTPKSLARS